MHAANLNRKQECIPVGCVPSAAVTAGGGVLPQCMVGHTPHCGQNSWHTLVKTLRFRNYVADGNQQLDKSLIKSVRIRQEQINYRKTPLPCNLLEEVILLWLYLCLALLLLLCQPLLSWWNACWWAYYGQLKFLCTLVWRICRCNSASTMSHFSSCVISLR